MAERPRILMAGGGTGGHVIPAIAIAGELRDRYGAEVRFVGTAAGQEMKLVPAAGYKLVTIKIGKLKGMRLLTRAKTMADLPLGVLRCMRLLHAFKPQAVVGVGGYASGPAMMAAVLMRIPTLAFEPNAVPGLANRLVGKWVTAAAVSFKPTRQYFRNARVTGRPVREEFFAMGLKESGPPRLLVMGGSQGAQALNETLPKIANELLESVPKLLIVHAAGERHLKATAEFYKRAGVPAGRYRVAAFVDSVKEMREADLVLCRSGGTVEELCAAGRPSVLVPFPFSADDHQRKNADAMVAGGAAVLLPESEMTPERLFETLRELLMDVGELHRMSVAARRMAHPRALEEIGEMVMEISRK